MKKLIYIALLIITFTACQSNDELEILNPYINTSWTSDDPIAAIIYGNGTTITIDFINDTECQEIKYRPSRTFGSVDIKQGTYTYTENSVTWLIDENTTTVQKIGSLLVRELSGGITYVYTKN